VIYRIVIVPTALKMLREISDQRVRQKICDRIDSLSKDPEKQGKPLMGELAGYRSLRTVGQRYRILYRVCESDRLVSVVALGIRKEGDRKNIYALAKKLLRLHLLD